jgi:hypothetical protein
VLRSSVMVRAAVLGIAVMGAGCAQLFGIDETSAPDAPPPTPFVSLQIDRVSIGSTLERAPLDLTGETASFFVEDAADASGLRRVPAMLADTNDRWTGEVPEGVCAAVEFTLPEAVTFRRLFAFPSRTLSTLHGFYEHPNPESAPVTSTFNVKLTLPTGYASGQLFRLYAVGPWVQHTFVAGELPAPDLGATTITATVPYNATGFPSLVGTRPTPKLTALDQIVALRYVGNDLTAAGRVPPFDQTAGADPVVATLTAVPHAPLDVKIDPAAVAMRLAGTSPPVSALSMAWSVVAAPAWQLANNNGPLLNAVGVAPTDPMMVTAMFGNPFSDLGWTSLFTWAANRSRAYTVPKFSLGLTLYAGLIHQDDVAPALVMDQPAGVPVLVSVNQTPLSQDGLTLTIDPTKAVTLSLVADRATNLFYQWNIYEVVPNAAMTALEYKVAYVALSNETTMKVPNDVFVAGKVYMIRAHCIQGGFPTFASGDLKNRDVPYAVGYLDAGVFTVAAP